MKLCLFICFLVDWQFQFLHHDAVIKVSIRPSSVPRFRAQLYVFQKREDIRPNNSLQNTWNPLNILHLRHPTLLWQLFTALQSEIHCALCAFSIQMTLCAVHCTWTLLCTCTVHCTCTVYCNVLCTVHLLCTVMYCAQYMYCALYMYFTLQFTVHCCTLL